MQAAKAEQDKVMLDKVTRDNGARLQQRALAAQQARLEEQRWEISLCCWLPLHLLLQAGAYISYSLECLVIEALFGPSLFWQPSVACFIFSPSWLKLNRQPHLKVGSRRQQAYCLQIVTTTNFTAHLQPIKPEDWSQYHWEIASPSCVGLAG